MAACRATHAVRKEFVSRTMASARSSRNCSASRRLSTTMATSGDAAVISENSGATPGDAATISCRPAIAARTAAIAGRAMSASPRGFGARITRRWISISIHRTPHAAFRLTASATAPARLAEALRAKAEAGSHEDEGNEPSTREPEPRAPSPEPRLNSPRGSPAGTFPSPTPRHRPHATGGASTATDPGSGARTSRARRCSAA